MPLSGIHHITAITGDAPGNVDFYARVLGLRMLKKTVNQDDPTVYHLFYGDEDGTPGNDLTFFEYPGALPGKAGAGMVHRIVWRVASPASIDYWDVRLSTEGVDVARVDGRLRFSDPEGLEHELAVVATADEPLTARHNEVPAEHALQGFDSVHAYHANPDASADLLETAFGGVRDGDSWEVRSERRGSWIHYDQPPATAPLQGAGSVHHVAWASKPDELLDWRERVASLGLQITPEIDRFYFRSLYFREPSGVLFEIATEGPGFAVDESVETLGERLSLPPNFEHVRERVEQTLQPLPDVRQWRP
ncbi:MAG: VOC family protein [Thermoleophilaceae bacterium]|nr:VOC family protein [Thermoleophilaceae bacterium]